MGNVHAASAPPPPLPPTSLTPELPTSLAKIDSVSSKESFKLQNPGTIEDLNKKCRG